MDELTQKEFNVAYLFAQGRTYGEIAKYNRIGQGQVRTRLENAYAKLGIRGQLDLAKIFEREFERKGSDDGRCREAADAG